MPPCRAPGPEKGPQRLALKDEMLLIFGSTRISAYRSMWLVPVALLRVGTCEMRQSCGYFHTATPQQPWWHPQGHPDTNQAGLVAPAGSQVLPMFILTQPKAHAYFRQWKFKASREGKSTQMPPLLRHWDAQHPLLRTQQNGCASVSAACAPEAPGAGSCCSPMSHGAGLRAVPMSRSQCSAPRLPGGAGWAAHRCDGQNKQPPC